MTYAPFTKDPFQLIADDVCGNIWIYRCLHPFEPNKIKENIEELRAWINATLDKYIQEEIMNEIKQKLLEPSKKGSN